jgi:hypothetical protein
LEIQTPIVGYARIFAASSSFAVNIFLKNLWLDHGDYIVEEHVEESPGTRPALWRLYDAPRLPIGTFPRCYYDGKKPMPRKRLGGTGTPEHEVRNVVPYFDHGIPSALVSIDDDDPPTFESQAAYLKRHGMFLAGEEKRANFEPETVYSQAIPPRTYCLTG